MYCPQRRKPRFITRYFSAHVAVLIPAQSTKEGRVGTWGGGRGQQPHDVVSGPWWGISQHCACREAGVWFSLGKRERRCWGEVCKCAAGWEERSSGRMRWHSAQHPAPAEKGDAHVTGPTGQMARRQGRERPHCAVELPHLLLSWTQRTMLC